MADHPDYDFIERLSDVVDAPTEQPEDSQPIALPPIKGKVEFENVSFRFNPSCSSCQICRLY